MIYSALFLDFDNVYASLRNDSNELATRFAARPLTWIKALETGLSGDTEEEGAKRRILAQRCYASPHTIGNYRRQFTQAGLEVIDCPPLTSRMKNSADIYIVMDIIDYLTRYPHIQEFIILSADADFAPVLHRLRKELKSSVIFTSFDTASSYKNCSDLTINADFFRKHLQVDESAARQSGTALTRDATPRIGGRTALPDDFWPRAEADLIAWGRSNGNGRIPQAAAALAFKATFPELMGSDWAGYGRFGALLADAKFETLVFDRDHQEYRIPDFRFELPEWGEAGGGDMPNFVSDVLRLQEKRIPLLAPSVYSRTFDALAEAFRASPESYSSAIEAAAANCAVQGDELSVQDIRFIATGVSLQGYVFDAETVSDDIASAWRINVWDLCGEPDWMREEEEASLLATWFHAMDESIEEGAADFLQRSAFEPTGEGG